MRIEGQAVGMRGRGSYRGNEGENEGRLVFAFKVLLTPSDSGKQSNLCGQETPRGSDMCSC